MKLSFQLIPVMCLFKLLLVHILVFCMSGEVTINLLYIHWFLLFKCLHLQKTTHHFMFWEIVRHFQQFSDLL